MSLLPQQITIKQYPGDGAETIFIYNFLVPLDGDIEVYLTPAGEIPDPSADLQTLNVDYTVQGAGVTDGGTITFTTAPEDGAVITLSRNVAASSETNFQQAATLNGENLDDAIERLTLLAQQSQSYYLRRNLSYKINADLPLEYADIQQYTQLPILEANQIWLGSAGGVLAATLEENPDVSVLRSELANQALNTDGAGLIGFYDVVNTLPTTVRAFLNNLPAYLAAYDAANVVTFKSGMLMDYAGTVAPSGWLLCDGTAVSRTTYAALFAVISTTWGVGDGSTTFNLPNLARRVTIGSGGSATSPVFTGTTVGSLGGEEVHVQTLAELVAHTHPPLAPTTSFLGNTGGSGGTDTSSNITSVATTGSTGSSTAFNVMQLGAVVMKIIKT